MDLIGKRVQRVIYPSTSVFSYDPRWEEIRLGAVPALYYMCTSSSFFVDQNPGGDRALVPVADVLVDQPGGALRLTFGVKDKPVDYLVSAMSVFDHLIFGLVSALSQNSGLTAGAADDKLDVACEKGLVRTCYITRVFEGDAPRSLRIVRKDEGLHVVIPSPRYQARVTSLTMNGTELRIDCDDGVTVGRMLSLPQPILAFFTEVVDELREAAGR
ncbi:hypothetical protein [Stenotrophomonas sp. ZAC14A_NAIMI4_1]|uniref:hypothetical protein n=1 Tax=Stenotrophomonas sp. ZAC14A_NAIMI4_1 TaxID=2072412 RepID=UPI00131F154E|nr:hypothetical protein [Stenotrophomonas sp. ZAC14A_NAIMI4_1]